MRETPSELLIAAEVARWLRITCSTVYAWAAMGKIPCVKMNGTIRFVRSDLDRWIEDHARKASDPAPYKVRPILPLQFPVVSRVTIQQAGTRAIRQIMRRQKSQQNPPRVPGPPTAAVGEQKDAR
jgi:excisionase family DNA binding protein